MSDSLGLSKLMVFCLEIKSNFIKINLLGKFVFWIEMNLLVILVYSTRPVRDFVLLYKIIYEFYEIVSKYSKKLFRTRWSLFGFRTYSCTRDFTFLFYFVSIQVDTKKYINKFVDIAYEYDNHFFITVR